jgi:hypothetical protein
MYGSPAFPHSPQQSPGKPITMNMGLNMGMGMGIEERGLFEEDVNGLGMGIYS